MDPFNIIIKRNNKQIDLNIHPQEAGSFKIIANGILIGEIFMGSAALWEATTVDDLEFESNTSYKDIDGSVDPYLLKNQEVVQQIGEMIAQATNSNSSTY